MSNVSAFEKAGKEIFGEYGCLPMIAYGTAKTLSAFKLLARARDLDFDTSNIVSKQIQNYELDVKHAKENNQDDPDYDVDDDVKIEDYVEEQYLNLIEDSKQYKGIVTNLSPHPCAHLLLDKDIREEIGVIRVKAKSGNKEAVYAAYIDGASADAYGYLKCDMLKVDVVKVIASTFEACGLPVMTVDELLEKVKDDQPVWDLYAKGFTMGLNQCEREKTTERVRQYQPKNVVELCAFVAAVRPGFKSMLSTFISRTPFDYGIPSLDRLLQSEEIPDSFLMYDENVLTILQEAGITPSDAYVCIKAIKKKKADKVASFKQRFVEGFSRKLISEENKSEEEAAEIVDKIWTIINDGASYLFNCSHAYSMACDSLYAAYLKVHHPYELYATMLKLYTEKGNKEKIASIISEMKRYKGIQLKPGSFGQDNRDWLTNKDAHTISQAISSVKFISKQAAEDLYIMSQMEFNHFSEALRYLQMNTCLNTRQINTLIGIGYFEKFGESQKLMTIFDEFYNGTTLKMKITKTLKDATVEKRLSSLIQWEDNLPNEPLPIEKRLELENDNIGLCMSVQEDAPSNMYFVLSVDDKYGVKTKLYSVKRGTSGVVRMTKKNFEVDPFEVNQCICIDDGQNRPKYAFRGGQRVPIQGESDYWITKCHIANA